MEVKTEALVVEAPIKEGLVIKRIKSGTLSKHGSRNGSRPNSALNIKMPKNKIVLPKKCVEPVK